MLVSESTKKQELRLFVPFYIEHVHNILVNRMPMHPLERYNQLDDLSFPKDIATSKIKHT